MTNNFILLPKIEVTRDDIKHGKLQDCKECPFAKATRRVLQKEFPGWNIDVSVDGEQIELWLSRYLDYEFDFAYRLNSKNRVWINNFDSAMEVSPLTLLNVRFETPEYLTEERAYG